MGNRRILVIGSQCDKAHRLSFLPELARELYTVMTDPNLGHCQPALDGEEGAGLLLDPTVEQAKQAIKQAFQAASRNQDTLLLAYVGHGQDYRNDFYLLPRDAQAPPDSDTAIHLVQLIKEQHDRHSGVDGLVVLIDACFAGKAATAAATRWGTVLEGRLRFEVLTGTDDSPAYDGCFTRTLIDNIRSGMATLFSDFLRCENFLNPVVQRCRQMPHLPSYKSGRDPGLWIAHNTAWTKRTEAWRKTGTAEEIDRLTVWYQPPAQLAEVVAVSERNRCVALVGLAGSGKSTTAAALARPEVTEGVVSSGFVHAVVFLVPALGSFELASRLADQLALTVRGFTGAREEFQKRTSEEERKGLNSLQLEVLGPLRVLSGGQVVRIIIDGQDQRDEALARPLDMFLDSLITDPALHFIRLIVTSRPDTPLPPAASRLVMDTATEEELGRYFERRELPEERRPAAVSRADRNWLVARLLGDLYRKDPEHFAPQVLPPGLEGIYEEALRRVGAGEQTCWRQQLRPVLTVLAAAGVGPVLPFPLLVSASAGLGGPSSLTSIHDLLVDLRGFVVRSAPGTPQEQVGLFHQTLADYLALPANTFGGDLKEAHQALLEAIEELAPASAFDPKNVNLLHRYAAIREAEHLWQVGRVDEICKCLEKRTLLIPRENLARWKQWKERIESKFGPDHPDTLATRHNIADLTGDIGDARQALRLFRELLPDLERVLGKDHPITLTTRNNIAIWTGWAGDAPEALRLLQELLPNLQCVLGTDHPDTLRTRNNINYWTSKAGDARQALRLFRELLPDLERVLGKDHPITLTTRNNIAAETRKSGDMRKALRLAWELLPDRERVLGRDHPDTLITRNNIAAFTGDIGDAPEALRLFWELLPDLERVLGKDHPITLTTRNNIAAETRKSGDMRKALRLFQELLPDQERVLGRDHPDTLTTWYNIAYWTRVVGDAPEALRLFQELLPDLERLLGRDHPDTLTTRLFIELLSA